MAYCLRMITRSSLLGLALLVGGCGGGPESVCTSASNKMHGCGLDKIHITASNAYAFPAECDPTTTCIAGCFMEASCADLQQVVPGGKFHTCLVGCNSWFRVADAGL